MRIQPGKVLCLGLSQNIPGLEVGRRVSSGDLIGDLIPEDLP